jgi:signal transduction histidine kinase
MWQKALHPDDEQRIHDETNRTAATGDPYNVEYRLRRHDGQYRWHVARAVPVRDSTGKIVIWVGCAADIEDQKQAEATLIRFTSKLERQVRERTRELQTVANDLHREVAQRTKLENQLLEVSEQEQRRIGQDLHDGVGQRLAAVRFLSAGLSKRLGHGHHPAARRTRGLGLSSMRYRAALIGATFAIRRGKHGGTVVTCGWTPAGKRLHGGRDAR